MKKNQITFDLTKLEPTFWRRFDLSKMTVGFILMTKTKKALKK